MVDHILQRYPVLQSIPKLAGYKMLLLNLGVDCSATLHHELPILRGMKVKYRVKKHQVSNDGLIDVSEDDSLIPSEVFLVDGDYLTLSKISYQPSSPIMLIVVGSKLKLVDKVANEELSIELEPVRMRDYAFETIPPGIDAIEGMKLHDYVQIVGVDRLGILCYSGCYHWLQGDMCKFCDENPKRPSEHLARPSLNSLVKFQGDVERWWAAQSQPYVTGIRFALDRILRIESLEPHRHLQIMAGNLPNADMEWKIAFQIAGAINSVRPLSEFDSILNILPPRYCVDLEFLEAARSLGFKSVEFNLEVIGNDYFAEVCPGKNSLSGYDHTVKSLINAVRFFGIGNVRSNFVLGAQPVKHLVRGVRELADLGIVADFSVFIPKAGTPWAKKDPPDMETVVNFTRELAAIHREYGFSAIYCNLSSRSSILHEIQMF